MNRILCVTIFLWWSGYSLLAQPFICTGELILAVSPEADSSDFYEIVIAGDPGAVLSFDQFSNSPGPYLNAIGYRQSDNFIYGIAPNTHDLYRLDASGNTTFLHHFDFFEETKSYNAGAVTPDSKYLVVLSGQATSAPFRTLEVLLIDLESADYSTTVIPVTTMSGEAVYSLDIAFDPFTGELYGFDGNEGRLITIQIFSGLIDDVAFPATGTISIMAALFFDTFGELYGYAKHLGQPGIKAFYHIDKNTGDQQFLLEGPLASASDGCSCPYRVELLKSVEPITAGGCTEITYTFEVANATGLTQSGIQFHDELPEGFQVVAVYGNTFGGQITGIGSGILQIDQMTIPPGIDTFFVRVLIGNVSPGTYKNQAQLNNLPSSIGSVEYSDDPATLEMKDSTKVQVLAVDIDVFDQELTICPGDTVVLDGTIGQFVYEYTWAHGPTGPVVEVTTGGVYTLYAENDCEPREITFFVEEVSPDLTLDLGPDLTVPLGDEIVLDPGLSNVPGLAFNWTALNNAGLSCFDCPIQNLTPLESTTYLLTITDENGCQVSDTIEVVVQKNYQVFVPSAFSPNNDGINDFFKPYGKAGILVDAFQVFDRWGGLIFQVNDVQSGDDFPGWDGSINGMVVPEGVYVWQVKVVFADGFSRIFSGDVTVVY
jgi:gliding motility-associated-like protein/uncharacterized repeat protein (TIGR01451 family)